MTNLKCKNCGGTQFKEMKGISKKTGRPYHFFKCENCGQIENVPKVDNNLPAIATKDLIIIELLEKINDRLDGLGEYLEKKFNDLKQ